MKIGLRKNSLSFAFCFAFLKPPGRTQPADFSFLSTRFEGALNQIAARRIQTVSDLKG